METRSVLEYTVGSTLWLSSDSQSETLEVLVDEKSPFISTITMMDPSPDFFSGFYDQQVLDEKTNTWYESFTISTYPWDAGTQTGDSFLANSSPLDPAQPVSFLTDPNVPGSAAGVFLNPDGTSVDPVAKWTCTVKEFIVPTASPVAAPAMTPLMSSPSLYTNDSPAIMTPSVSVYDYLGLDPTFAPSEATKLPSLKPTNQSASEPTPSPTLILSAAPTTSPTLLLTQTATEPTNQPTSEPTEQPTFTPTVSPTRTIMQVSSELGVEFPFSATGAPTIEPSSATESTPNPTITQETSEPTLQPSDAFDSAETGAPQISIIDQMLEPALNPSAAIGSSETAAPQDNGDVDTIEPILESAETGAPQASEEDTTKEPTTLPSLGPSSAASSGTTSAPQRNEPSTPFESGPTAQPTKTLTEQPVAQPSYDLSPTVTLMPAGYHLDPPIGSPVLSPVHLQLEDAKLIGWLGRGHGSFSSTLSRDGSTVAIAYKGEHQDSDQTVFVSIYRYSPNGTWVQIGDDIIGDLHGDEEGVGNSVALSYDGNTIAVGFFSAPCGRGIVQATCGRVSVYFYNGAGWMHRGQDIFSEHPNDLSGYSLSMSDDGLRLAIGSPTNAGPGGTSSGQVRLFELDPIDEWRQLATDIEGDGSWDYFGHSVAISADGTTLACGAVEALPGEVGYVKIYRYNATADSFDQLGTDLGKDLNDHVAFSLSLSSDGNILAIGSTPQEGIGVVSGIVRVYQYENDSWGLLTPDVVGGYNRKDKFGYAVSLVSLDAKNGKNMLVVGAPETDTMKGSVALYEIGKGTWSLLKKLRSSEPMSGNDYGRSVTIADSGSLFVVGGRAGAYVYEYPMVDADAFPSTSPILQTMEPTVVEDKAILTNDPTVTETFTYVFTEKPTSPGESSSRSESTTEIPTQEGDDSEETNQPAVMTMSPTISVPTRVDFPAPSTFPESPTYSPTVPPTDAPSESPTLSRANSPTSEPSAASRTPSVADPTASAITDDSTAIPTKIPTVVPTLSPTGAPSASPSSPPTYSLTDFPIISPTSAITPSPSESPTSSPTYSPTTARTPIPTMDVTQATLSPTRPPIVLTLSPTIVMRPSDGNQLPPYWGSSYIYDDTRQPAGGGTTNGLQEPSYYLDDETSAPIQQPASDYYFLAPVRSPVYNTYYGEPSSGETASPQAYETASPQAYGDETRAPV